MENLLNTLSDKLQNELKDYVTDFVGVYEGELFTTSEYDLTPEVIQYIETELNLKQ